MNVGIIGNGFHSKRIQNILKKKKINFFLYKPDKPKYHNTKNFDKIKKCKIIFIISPNKTHFSYIKKLYHKRYIFCEKPPVSSISELKKLKKIKSNKIYFNYNFRFLKISEILENQKKYNLGKLLNANLISSHGLSLKTEYKNSWRSNIKKCKKGVYEIVSIHWIDLINYHFAIKKISLPKLLNFSRIGSSFDTSSVEIILQNDSIVNIFSTYNSAYAKRLFFLFQNGIIEQVDNILTIKGPAINLDKKGFFKKPNVIKSFYVSENNDYIVSLEKSINFFLNIAMNKKVFNRSIFDYSIKSNSLIL